MRRYSLRAKPHPALATTLVAARIEEAVKAVAGGEAAVAPAEALSLNLIVPLFLGSGFSGFLSEQAPRRWCAARGDF